MERMLDKYPIAVAIASHPVFSDTRVDWANLSFLKVMRNKNSNQNNFYALQGMIVGPQEVPEHICTSYECRHFRQVVSVHCSYCGVGCGLHALVLIGHGVTDEGQRFWMLRDSYGEEGREDGNILIEKGKDVLGIDPRETWEFAPMRRLPWGSKWWGKLVKRSEHERLIEESWKEAERETGE
ncbi:hypothetical protein ACFX2K_029245 [Malus domestica]